MVETSLSGLVTGINAFIYYYWKVFDSQINGRQKLGLNRSDYMEVDIDIELAHIVPFSMGEKEHCTTSDSIMIHA